MNLEQSVNENAILLCLGCRSEIPMITFSGSNSTIIFKTYCTVYSQEIYVNLQKYLEQIKIMNDDIRKHIDLEEKYCSNCIKWIDKGEILEHEKHILIDYPINLVCPRHHEDYTDYCNECKLSICQHCHINHQNHKMSHIQSLKLPNWKDNEVKIKEFFKSSSEYHKDYIPQLALQTDYFSENSRFGNKLEGLTELYLKNKEVNQDLITFLKLMYNTEREITFHPHYQFNQLCESVQIREYHKYSKEIKADEIYPLYINKLKTQFILFLKTTDQPNETNINQLTPSHLSPKPKIKSPQKNQGNSISIILPEKERENRVPGWYEDLPSQTKLKHNTYILHAIRLLKEENTPNGITAFTLDGKECRTTKTLLSLGSRLKKLYIIELNAQTYEIIKLFSQSYPNITVMNQHVNHFFEKHFDPNINVIYFDVMCSYKSSELTRGSDIIIEQFLEKTKMDEIIFAATFCLRNGSNCQFQEHSDLVVSGLINQFTKYRFDYTLLLSPDEILYKGQSANPKSMMFVIYHLLRNNEI